MYILFYSSLLLDEKVCSVFKRLAGLGKKNLGQLARVVSYPRS